MDKMNKKLEDKMNKKLEDELNQFLRNFAEVLVMIFTHSETIVRLANNYYYLFYFFTL